MITSRVNPQVKEWVSLSQKKNRELSNLFLIEGEHLVEEALNQNRLKMLIKSESYSGKLHFDKTEEISLSVAEKLSSTKSTQTIFGLVSIVNHELSGTRWLFLDSIQDPGNVGTLIRSAVSFGYDAVILNKNCADVYSDKVVRSSQGSLFHIKLLNMEFDEVVKETQKHQIKLVGTYLNNRQDKMLSDHVCLCLGHEGSGLNPDYEQFMDHNVLVETSNFESLNVAVAGSILMYQSRR